MKIKSLALVAAAAVVSAGAAQAADLNKPAKVAVDYVKVCDAYGAGFFYIPGSDTCLQISGYARATFVAGSSRDLSTYTSPAGVHNPYYLGLGTARGSNDFSTGIEAQVGFDARTNTSFGLLRSYIQADIDYGSNSAGKTSVDLERAFVQWGGLTAGRIETNFAFFQGYNDELFFSELAPDYQVNALSYTFAFGNGVTATIGIEDSASASSYGGLGTRINSNSFGYQGNKVPDIVANLNVTQAWGAAQISAAAHNVYGAGNGVNVNRWGYAVLAGVWFNVPTFGAGDMIGFQGMYTQGATGYTTAGEQPFQVTGYGGTGDLGTDATVNATTGSVKLGTAWNAYASFVHNFTPTVSLAIGGGFQGATNNLGTGTATLTSVPGDKLSYTLGAIGGTVFWTPVKGLSINTSLEYENIAFSSTTKSDLALRNGDAWIVGLRVKRSF
jgi:hypothetical protein